MRPASFLLTLALLPLLACGGDGNVLGLQKPVIHGQVAKIWKNGAELYSYGVSGSDTQAYGVALAARNSTGSPPAGTRPSPGSCWGRTKARP